MWTTIESGFSRWLGLSWRGVKLSGSALQPRHFTPPPPGGDEIPSSIQFDDFDINLLQCPSKEWLPENVNKYELEAFAELPESLVGVYDIVNGDFPCSQYRTMTRCRF